MTSSVTATRIAYLKNCSEQAKNLMDLKKQIKILEVQASAIADELATAAENGELDFYAFESGVYVLGSVKMSLVSRTTWSYSPAVKRFQEQEKEYGLATSKSSTYYKYADL